ncbi:MAG: alanine racemase [Spirochaetes bacterium]|nr:alanine racemase [Spirochaetota bacterium]
MIHSAPLPRLEIDSAKLCHNAERIVQHCRKAGIRVNAVVKGCAAHPAAAKAMLDGGCSSLGSSRLLQLKQLAGSFPDTERLLLRIPTLRELPELLKWADVSLQSDTATLIQLDEEARRQGVTHRVILMQDLGDIREGFWRQDELVEQADFVEKRLTGLRLEGLGTNLGCYGSIKPTRQKMEALVASAELIEERIGRTLDIISGGATSSYPLVLQEQMPPRVNHLRIGEGILLSRDLKEYYHCKLPDMHDDAFQLVAEIVEVKRKPSHPVGELFVDAFGNTPEYHDIGERLRAIVAIGRQDFGDHSKLIPLDPGVSLVGASSDHLIVDVEDYAGLHDGRILQTGETLRFSLYYPALLYLSLSTEIHMVPV